MSDRFGVLFEGHEGDRSNIRPSEDVPAVVDADGSRRAVYLRWGLVPSWAKDASTGYKIINARAETLLEKRCFSGLVESSESRCLIPADGFYEWKASEAPGRHKQPYLITLPGREIFSFAGLWTRWKGDGEQEVLSCTIITVEPNSYVSPIHDRMPAILVDEEAEERWLSAEERGRSVTGLLGPYPGEMVVEKVDMASPVLSS